MSHPLLVNLSFLISQPTGITTYATNLFPHLKSLNPTLLVSQTIDDYSCYPVPPNLTPAHGTRGHLLRLLWTQMQLPRIYQQMQPSLLFSPVPEAPLFSSCRYVVMVHDLIPLRFPRRFSFQTPYFRYYIPQVLAQAQHIICNSNATAQDITDFYQISSEKITPIPLAYDANHFRCLDLPGGPIPPTDLALPLAQLCGTAHFLDFGLRDTSLASKSMRVNQQPNHPKSNPPIPPPPRLRHPPDALGGKDGRQNPKSAVPYFLYIGRHDPYKNLHRLIDAFAALPSCRDHQLWLAGPSDRRYTPALMAQAEKLGITSQVKFLDYVPHAQLPVLINQAIALVFPTLWEGFGLPVLEAMACGTPVITSNCSSLPEVAGNAALLVNPYNVGEIAEAMQAVATDSGLRSRLRTLGLTRASQFTWAKTGLATAAVLQRYL